MTDISIDNDPCDTGKKAKLGRYPERFGPHDLFVDEIVGFGGEGAMEMRNRGDVPGARGKGACPETVDIVNEVGDYHVNNLQYGG